MLLYQINKFVTSGIVLENDNKDIVDIRKFMESLNQSNVKVLNKFDSHKDRQGLAADVARRINTPKHGVN
jgi:hypothetical protein